MRRTARNDLPPPAPALEAAVAFARALARRDFQAMLAAVPDSPTQPRSS